jgi:hypothetical protein
MSTSAQCVRACTMHNLPASDKPSALTIPTAKQGVTLIRGAACSRTAKAGVHLMTGQSNVMCNEFRASCDRGRAACAACIQQTIGWPVLMPRGGVSQSDYAETIRRPGCSFSSELWYKGLPLDGLSRSSDSANYPLSGHTRAPSRPWCCNQMTSRL